MKLNLIKEQIQEALSLSSRFTSSKLSSSTALQGVLLKMEKGAIHFYASNLSSYFHTFINSDVKEDKQIVVEPKKLGEFISLLPQGNLGIEIGEKEIIVTAGKASGSFPIISPEDFPLPPSIEEKPQKIKTSFLKKNLPLVMFATSSDDSRPILTGVNFISGEDLTMVATDGFRLSLVKTKKEGEIPSVVIPAGFLEEVLHNAEGEEIEIAFSKKEQLVLFHSGKNEFYTRLIEGDFPPFERVVPQEKKTTVVLEREEFLRNIKLISVFARDFSHVVVISFSKDGTQVKPKIEGGGQNFALQESEFEGEPQRVAFNHKFLLDFLSNIGEKKIRIEILRPDAPIVFRAEGNNSFLHIIMPVRVQE